MENDLNPKRQYYCMPEKEPLLRRLRKWMANGVKRRKRYEIENHMGPSRDALRDEGFAPEEVGALEQHYFEHPEELEEFPIFWAQVGREREASVLKFKELLKKIGASEKR